jgi:low temperature requirement protein LtrA
MTGPTPRLRMEAASSNATVTPLELFFDLVFVFALTQVTAIMAVDGAGVRELIRGVLVVAVLWWCWVGYSWLGSVVRSDEGVLRLALFGAMATMFVAALTIPEAFDDLPGGLSGPVVFAGCYFLFRMLHLGVFWVTATGDAGLRAQLVRFTPAVVGGTTLLLVASQTSGAVQTWLWVAALAVDYLGTMLGGSACWRLHSAAHFTERHGLIVIVALGESIVSIGVGVTDLPVAWPIIAAAALGLALAAAMWWAYFDVTSLLAERALGALRGEHRARVARDAYSFLHLPMIVGIILASLGLKKALGYVGGDDGHTIVDPIYGIPLVALYGGVALYLLGHVAFKWCAVHQVRWQRPVAAALLLGLIPVVSMLPALATLAIVTAVMIGLIGYETVAFAQFRDEIRHAPEHANPSPATPAQDDAAHEG